MRSMELRKGMWREEVRTVVAREAARARYRVGRPTEPVGPRIRTLGLVAAALLVELLWVIAGRVVVSSSGEILP